MTGTTISSKQLPFEAVLDHIPPGADIIMPNANGEPAKLIDTLGGAR